MIGLLSTIVIVLAVAVTLIAIELVWQRIERQRTRKQLPSDVADPDDPKALSQQLHLLADALAYFQPLASRLARSAADHCYDCDQSARLARIIKGERADEDDD